MLDRYSDDRHDPAWGWGGSGTSATLVRLSSSSPTAAHGRPVVLRAQVAAPAGGPVLPTGRVLFRAAGCTLGSAAVDPAGLAVLPGVLLPPGVHAVTASYSGDAGHAAATSPPLPQAVTVAAVPVVVLVRAPAPETGGVRLEAELVDPRTGRLARGRLWLPGLLRRPVAARQRRAGGGLGPRGRRAAPGRPAPGGVRRRPRARAGHRLVRRARERAVSAQLAELLDGLGRLAGDVGPVLAPAGRDDLVTAVASTAMRMFGAQACSLALLTDDDTELVFTTVVGAGSDRVRGLRLPSGQGIAGWVAMSGQPLVVSDLQRDPRWAGTSPDVGYTPRSILAAPVATSDRLLGVLEVLDRSEDRAEAAADLELLALVAYQAALALEGARAFDDFGRRLLRAAAGAGRQQDLSAQLLAAAERLGEPDGDLLELASLFGELGRLDADSRRLAVRVVRAFTDSARERQASARRVRGR